MKCRVIGLAVVQLTVFSILVVRAQTAPEKGAPKAPEGHVIVDEQDWLALENDLPRDFHQAREDFLKRDFQAAALRIRKGVTFLKVEAARASGDTKQALLTLAGELEKLASDVEKDTVRSVKDLDDAFVHTHYALAKHHHEQALAYQAKKDYKKAGYYLAAAVLHFEQASAWAGHKIDAAAADVTDDARIVSNKLIKGADWTSSEVEKAFEALDKEIERLAHTIYPGYEKLTRAMEHP
jgi:hypothetical protein